jgi:hypothetical protein
MSSPTQLHHLLSNHSHQPAIKQTLETYPELIPLYEAWTLNQHLLTNARAQECTLLTALVKAGISTTIKPLLSPINSPQP